MQAGEASSCRQVRPSSGRCGLAGLGTFCDGLAEEVIDALTQVDGLRVVDASSMPTIPSGNTYLGCVMVAERVARKMAQ